VFLLLLLLLFEKVYSSETFSAKCFYTTKKHKTGGAITKLLINFLCVLRTFLENPDFVPKITKYFYLSRFLTRESFTYQNIEFMQDLKLNLILCFQLIQLILFQVPQACNANQLISSSWKPYNLVLASYSKNQKHDINLHEDWPDAFSLELWCYSKLRRVLY